MATPRVYGTISSYRAECPDCNKQYWRKQPDSKHGWDAPCGCTAATTEMTELERRVETADLNSAAQQMCQQKSKNHK